MPLLAESPLFRIYSLNVDPMLLKGLRAPPLGLSRVNRASRAGAGLYQLSSPDGFLHYEPSVVYHHRLRDRRIRILSFVQLILKLPWTGRISPLSSLRPRGIQLCMTRASRTDEMSQARGRYRLCPEWALLAYKRAAGTERTISRYFSRRGKFPGCHPPAPNSDGGNTHRAASLDEGLEEMLKYANMD
ncbi:hypothetical protein FB451DRAFT_1172250 [Mycena latifolia]|nr:hypothetical protein FB451DRAFT_1172250 [Mycena latifolia]